VPTFADRGCHVVDKEKWKETRIYISIELRQIPLRRNIIEKKHFGKKAVETI
jgi:hypothetical protein